MKCVKFTVISIKKQLKKNSDFNVFRNSKQINKTFEKITNAYTNLQNYNVVG